ncbi:MAG: glycosyltransferase, partial [Caldilineaceae bacterium]
LEQVRAASRNFPIHLHVDLDRASLVELYGKSSLYWHASGYGEDEQKDPHKFEHFGITTVEAMAAGCVPIVIGKGGQSELVGHEVNGLLWHSLPELISLSMELIGDPTRMERLSKTAIVRSQQFDQGTFRDRLHKLLLQMDVNPI